MTKNNPTCSYKGHLYLLPNIERSNSTINISSIELTINQEDIYEIPIDPARFFINRRQLLRRLDIKFELSKEEDDNFRIRTYTFLIYKEGIEKPVSMQEAEFIGSENIHLSFHFDNQPLSYGNYFILGVAIKEGSDMPLFEQIEEHLCIPFRLLEDGQDLTHPSIVKATAIRRQHDIEQYGIFSPGELCFSIMFKEKSQRDNEFGIILYNNTWKSIDSAYRFDCKPQSSLTFHLHNEEAWLPEEYHVVIMHNQEPYAVATFEYKRDETISCNIRPLTRNEALYWMVTELECDATYQWKRIQKIPGISDIMPQLIHHARQGQFNQLCSKNNAGRMCRNTYLAIKTNVLSDARNLIMGLPELLHFETDYYKSLNCKKWRNDILLNSDESNVHPFKAATEAHTITISELSPLCESYGKEMLAEMEEAICNELFRGTVILYDTPEAIEKLLEVSPRLANLFTAENTLHLGEANAGYILRAIKEAAEGNMLFFSPQAMHELASQVLSLTKEQQLSSWRENEWEAYVKKSIIPLMRKRLAESYAQGKRFTKKVFNTIETQDIALPKYVKEQATLQEGNEKSNAFDESLKKLNRMVGLKEIKESLQETFLLLRFNEQRRRLGLPVSTSNIHHMIFTGNPGTGKTSVAELIGEIFHALGLLSEGKVIKAERKDLVKRYIGETESHMKDVLEKAQGNVLFIDEAYTLCDSLEDRKDFGHHVIEALLGVLTKPNPDMLIILAGYGNEMERLMEMNQGLKGRFPHRFNFEDYSFEELFMIGEKVLQEQQFILSQEADSALKEHIKAVLEHKDQHFSNARWIKQFITSGILPAMAKRIMNNNDANNIALYRTIEASDIAAAAIKYPIPRTITLKPRRMIGFRA